MENTKNCDMFMVKLCKQYNLAKMLGITFRHERLTPELEFDKNITEFRVYNWNFVCLFSALLGFIQRIQLV